MPKLGTLKSKEVIKILESNGFRLRRSKGSHFVFYHPENKKIIVVPFHAKDLPKGTLASILKQAGISQNKL